MSWLRNGRTVEHALAGPGEAPSAETLEARLAALISFYRWQEAVYSVPVAGRLMRGRAAPHAVPGACWRTWMPGLLPGPSSLVRVRRRPAGPAAAAAARGDPGHPRRVRHLRTRRPVSGRATCVTGCCFLLLAESGMRLGEALGMRISDFVMGRGGTAYIEIVPRPGNPNGARVKMMRPRRIYVSADLERLFADYLTYLACRAAGLGMPCRRGLAAAGEPRPPAAAGGAAARAPSATRSPRCGGRASARRVDAALVQAFPRLGLAAGRHPGMGGLPPPGPRPRADHAGPLWLGPRGRGAAGRGELEVLRVLLAGAR